MQSLKTELEQSLYESDNILKHFQEWTPQFTLSLRPASPQLGSSGKGVKGHTGWYGNSHVIIWLWKWWSLKTRSAIQKRSSKIHCKHEIMKPCTWGINIIISSYTFIDRQHSPSSFVFPRSLGRAPVETLLFSQHLLWSVGPRLDEFQVQPHQSQAERNNNNDLPWSTGHAAGNVPLYFILVGLWGLSSLK